MGGGLMQLVAYGAQDVYLTGNPQITFFKVVYRRHTNFSVESIEQTFNGAAKLGNKFSCTISRNGDLLSQVYLEMDVSLSQSHAVSRVQVEETGFTDAVLSRIQQKQLCSMASGTNSSTGESTSYSLGC